MTNGEILNLVSGHPFLTGLPDACLELIANHGQLQSFAKGDYLTREKQIANQFFLMLDGHVRLEMQTHTGTTTIETVSAPAALGWSWLVYPHKWHYASMALDRVETVCVQAQPILTALQQDKNFGYEIYKRYMNVIVDRLHGAHMQMLDVYAIPEGSAL